MLNADGKEKPQRRPLAVGGGSTTEADESWR